MSAPRIHHPHVLQIGDTIELSEQASRHVQVLRMQPGETVRLFPGSIDAGNQEFTARILHMGRRSVSVQVEAVETVNRELPRAIHLAVGMPSNDRMDWLVEKATELGAASITPLITERTVLRLQGERAEKKRQHWQAIAIAACEQCGRNTVPSIHVPLEFDAYAASNAQPMAQSKSLLLTFVPQAHPIGEYLQPQGANSATSFRILSGPEGGLSPREETLVLQNGFAPVTLGKCILRAETAPLKALAMLDIFNIVEVSPP